MSSSKNDASPGNSKLKRNDCERGLARPQPKADLPKGQTHGDHKETDHPFRVIAEPF